MFAALAAIVAVLWTASSLDAEKRALLDHAWVMVHAVDGSGSMDKVKQGHAVDLFNLRSPAQANTDLI
jgi:hypothetical protein